MKKKGIHKKKSKENLNLRRTKYKQLSISFINVNVQPQIPCYCTIMAKHFRYSMCSIALYTITLERQSLHRGVTAQSKKNGFYTIFF